MNAFCQFFSFTLFELTCQRETNFYRDKEWTYAMS